MRAQAERLPIRAAGARLCGATLWFGVAAAVASTAFAGTARPRAPEPYVKNHVVVDVWSQSRNPQAPWEKLPVTQRTYIATVVGPDRILLTASAVQDAAVIEMAHFGGSEKYPLNVVFFDVETNLALLQPRVEGALRGHVALAIGPLLKPGANVTLLTLGSRLRPIGKTTNVVGVEVQFSGTGTYPVTTYQLPIAKEIEVGRSEPVIEHGKLVGIAISTSGEKVSAVPSGIISRFLERAATRGNGQPAAGLGIRIQTQVAPELRAYLGAATETGGVRVARVSPTSPFYRKVKEDDLLLNVAGEDLSEFGTVEDPVLGRVFLMHVLNGKKAGDELSVSLLRNGTLIHESAILKPYVSNEAVVPYSMPLEGAAIIFGGVVFLELTQEYLESWGANYLETAPAHLLHFEDAFRRSTHPSERVVLVSRVFADPVTHGYEKIAHAIVEQVNGVSVRSLKDVRDALLTKAIPHVGSRYAKIDLWGGAGTLVLAYDKINAANTRIGTNYSVAESRFFLNVPQSLSH